MVAATQPLILPLKVFSVSPLSLTATSSATFTITGDYFSDSTTVEMRIGSGSNVVTNTVWSTNNQLTVTTGAIAAGSYSVTVINGGARVVATQTVTVNPVNVPFLDLSTNAQALTIGQTRSEDIYRTNSATVTQGVGGLFLTGNNWSAYQVNAQTSVVGTDVKDVEFIFNSSGVDFVMYGFGRDGAVNVGTGYHWGYALCYLNNNTFAQVWGGGSGGSSNQVSSIPTVNTTPGWHRVTVTRNGDSGDGGRILVHRLLNGNPSSWEGGTEIMNVAIPATQDRPTGTLRPMVSASANSGDIRAVRVKNSA